MNSSALPKTLMGTPFKNDFINQSIEIILPQNDHSDSVISF